MVTLILHEQHLDGTVGRARARDCGLTVACSLDSSGRPWNTAPVSRIISRHERTVQGARGTGGNGGGRRGFAFFTAFSQEFCCNRPPVVLIISAATPTSLHLDSRECCHDSSRSRLRYVHLVVVLDQRAGDSL